MKNFVDITNMKLIFCDCHDGEHSKYLVINDRFFAIGINEDGIFKCNEINGISYELLMKDINKTV